MNILQSHARALRDTEKDLAKLAGKSLDKMDLIENSNLIRNVYITFQNRLTSDVSVTKALRVIDPRLLMMWDRDIRAIYHRSHDNDHIEGKEECYLKFLKKCVGS